MIKLMPSTGTIEKAKEIIRKGRSTAIEFESPLAAQRYSKKIIRQPLNQKKAFERMTIIDGNKILYVKNGNATGVALNIKEEKSLIGKKNLLIYHGHPYDNPNSKIKTTETISGFDYAYLNQSDWANEIVAFTQKGEFSKLTKNQNFVKRTFDETQATLREILDTMLTQAPKKLRIQYNNFMKRVDEGKSISPLRYNALNEKIGQFQGTQKGINSNHNFWQKMAEKFGLKYETNYSFLDKTAK